MQRKNKIIIIATIVGLILLMIGLISGSLDRLDFENYGLNYNYITANFSTDAIYESGLHVVGFTNVLLEVPKTQRFISIKNIKSYTNDFFPLEVSAEISYHLVLPTQNNFTFLEDFYINFGSNPETTLYHLMKNSVINVVSNYSSTDYQNQTDFSSLLQTKIQTNIQNQMSIWTNMQVTVLLSQLVAKGISLDTESLDRKIQALTSKAQRVQARRTDLTSMINSTATNAQLQADIIYQSILNRIQSIITLQNSSLTTGVPLQEMTAVSHNLSLFSLGLQMRPQFYIQP